MLPGETTREVFPFHDANLTAFEKARLQPPHPEDLNHRMLHEGIRPVGPCLVQLILNADSIEMGIRYLKDSPFWQDASALADLSPSEASLGRLRLVPPSIFECLDLPLMPLAGSPEPDHQQGHTRGSTSHQLIFCGRSTFVG